mgnify:CR=1 FL=1
MKNYITKINECILPYIKNIQEPRILEFGVKEGRSTKMFLDVCKQNNGKLISVDIDDYEKLFEDKNWTFLNTRDDDFDKIDHLVRYFDEFFNSLSKYSLKSFIKSVS